RRNNGGLPPGLEVGTEGGGCLSRWLQEVAAAERCRNVHRTLQKRRCGGGRLARAARRRKPQRSSTRGASPAARGARVNHSQIQRGWTRGLHHRRPLSRPEPGGK